VTKSEVLLAKKTAMPARSSRTPQRPAEYLPQIDTAPYLYLSTFISLYENHLSPVVDWKLPTYSRQRTFVSNPISRFAF
jgi:hypothetical protein